MRHREAPLSAYAAYFSSGPRRKIFVPVTPELAIFGGLVLAGLCINREFEAGDLGQLTERPFKPILELIFA